MTRTGLIMLVTGVLINSLTTNTALAEDIDALVGWSQRVEMSTAVSGVVDEVLINVGDQVSKGDVLLRLDTTRIEAAVKSAKASKKDAQYKLNEAEREWHRARELYDRTVLSDRDLQLAENGLITAQAVFAQASSHYISASRDLIESSIRAPFAAVILERRAEPGQTVVTRLQSVPLLTLAATKNYLALGMVSPLLAGKLASGQPAAVTVGGKKFNGIITSVGFEPVANGNGYPISVRFVTGGSLLRAGQPATIHLP